MSERDDFLKAHMEVEEKLNFVVQILPAVYAQKVEPRRAWANLLFFRLFSVGQSILTLCIEDLRQKEPVPTDFCSLDHSSIAALTRTLLDTWLMFSYVSEIAISEEEWLLRRAALELHLRPVIGYWASAIPKPKRRKSSNPKCFH